MEKPERKYVVGIRVEADDWDNIVFALEDICARACSAAETDIPGISVVSAGYGGSFLAFSKENDINHDEYFEMLDAWLEEQRALQKA